MWLPPYIVLILRNTLWNGLELTRITRYKTSKSYKWPC